jgi:hypothetical protein
MRYAILALLYPFEHMQDALMLAAMDGRPFVTMGSSYREIDYERVWSNHLSKLAKKKRSSADTGDTALAAARTE